MDEIDQSRIGGFDSASSGSSEPTRTVSRLLLLWPLAGMIALVAVIITYRPLDEMLMWWLSGVPCVISYTLTNIAWRKAKAGGDVRSFFPLTSWLAVGCLFVPAVLFLNGALDHSPVEQHRQVVTRTIVAYGRSTSYYLEFTSWRANRTHEKVMVSERWYHEAKRGDPVIVEAHKGALGIPLLASVHKPD
jgi:hypothetical protein